MTTARRYDTGRTRDVLALFSDRRAVETFVTKHHVESDPDYKPGPMPKEASAWLKSKDVEPAERWQDAWGDEYRHAFYVAHMMEEDLLEDVRDSLDDALEQGVPFNEWRKDEMVRETFDNSGWTDYNGDAEDSPYRLRTIYDTNMRTARAAGQLERQDEVKDIFQYAQFNLGPSKIHRPQHEEWEGIIVRVDGKFFQAHVTPCGFGCKCFWIFMAQEDVDSSGVEVTEPDFEYEEYDDEETGKTTYSPEGVQPGFGRNPLTARDELSAQRAAIFGDASGHEFHGNQWTANSGQSAPPESVGNVTFTQVKAWEKSLTLDEEAAWDAWKGSDYKYLREADAAGAATPKDAAQLASLYAAFEKAPPTQGPVFRGMSNLSAADVAPYATVGATIAMKSVASWTPAPDVAMQFAHEGRRESYSVQLRLMRNSGIAKMVDLSSSEPEAVIGKGAQFKVTGVSKQIVDGAWRNTFIVNLEEVSK